MISELDGKSGQSASDMIQLLVFIMEEFCCCFIIFVYHISCAILEIKSRSSQETFVVERELLMMQIGRTLRCWGVSRERGSGAQVL